jgi:hypothetical protein
MLFTSLYQILSDVSHEARDVFAKERRLVHVGIAHPSVLSFLGAPGKRIKSGKFYIGMVFLFVLPLMDFLSMILKGHWGWV